MTEYEFAIAIERDRGGCYSAVCAALQECDTEGTTKADARDLIEHANGSPW